MVIKILTLLPFPFHHHCHLEAHEGRDYLEQVGIYICRTKKLYYKSPPALNTYCTDALQAVVCPFSFFPRACLRVFFFFWQPWAKFSGKASLSTDSQVWQSLLRRISSHISSHFGLYVTLGDRDFSSTVSGFCQEMCRPSVNTENSRRTREKYPG